MRRLYLLLTLTTMLLAVPSTALAGGGSRCSGFGTGDTVMLRDNCFSATALFVTPGQRMTIVNEGTIEHTYTAVDGSFDSGVLQPGGTATITAPDQGLVRVYCTLHSSRDGEGMAGLVLVSEVGKARTDAAGAQLTSATGTTAEAPPPPATQTRWLVVGGVAGGALLAVVALGVALRADRRVTAALRD